MQEIYDVVLIGSGPTAVAALLALPDNMKIAAATGAILASDSVNGAVHPKIDYISRLRGELRGVCHPLTFAGYKNGALYSTAIVGGLANYWGQQFLRYEENDPWPHTVFNNYSSYIAECEAIEKLFTCTSVAEHEQQQENDYLQRSPKLLMGSKTDPKAGLSSLKDVFESLSARKLDRITSEAVKSWIFEDGLFRLQLSNGDQLVAHQIILSAGVVGSLRLAMRSCPNLSTAKLSDHMPYLLYFMPKPGRANFRDIDAIDHFNSMRLERISGDRVRLFASVYRMSKAPVGLTLSAMGLPPWLPNVYLPGLLDLIRPIQIWTPSSKAHYIIRRDSAKAFVDARPVLEHDDELARFVDWLSHRGFIVRRSMTQPGFGFHFHAGSVSDDGETFQNLQFFLDAQYDGRVICADGSIIEEIGTRPHTLTAMAAAHRVISSVKCF